MNTKVIVVTHKEAPMPDRPEYVPVCVGKGLEELKNKYQPDNTGENISEKNDQYSELTALYWAWKNLDCDVLGLIHYRRLLTLEARNNALSAAITKEQIEEIMQKYDAIVPKPRRYFENVKNHYAHCQKGQTQMAKRRIEILADVIADKAPQYSECYEKIMRSHKVHMYNIYIMSKKDSDAYCEWLYDILFETEKRIDAEGVGYRRGMGELSEFLLDVWLQYHNKKCYEARVISYGYSLLAKLKFVIRRKLVGER